MRAATNGKQPRFIVWENVPGAYSSSGGDDFLRVLEEILKIKEDTFSVPLPPKRKWLSSGEIVGDNFSVAYKTIDAQHFGVPQRRRRIYLVADFDGECAGDVLFEYESVSWNFAEGRKTQETATDNTQKGVGATDDVVTVAFEQQAYDKFVENDKGACLKAQGGTYGGGSETLVVTDNKARRLTPLECCRLQGFPDYWCAELETLTPTDTDVAFWSGIFEEHRRIIGTSGKRKSRNEIIKWLKNPHSDAAEYKMWGNGIALPCAVFVLAGITILSRNGGEEE